MKITLTAASAALALSACATQSSTYASATLAPAMFAPSQGVVVDSAEASAVQTVVALPPLQKRWQGLTPCVAPDTYYVTADPVETRVYGLSQDACAEIQP